MREIEIKAKVSDPKRILVALKKHGRLIGDPVTQRDIVYFPSERHGKKTVAWMRLRTEDGHRHILNLKRSVTDSLDNIEHETVVENPSETRQILEQLGYKIYSDLTKTRQSAEIGGISVSLDNVESLGVFIEAEAAVDDQTDPNTTRSKLWELFESLGVKKSNEVTLGYDELMRAKHGPPQTDINDVYCTLVFFIRQNRLLLGMKKRGFGRGKLNGFGGKIHTGETSLDAAIRESQEEVNLTPTELTKVAVLEYLEWYQGRQERVHIDAYLCESWEGEPKESEEMAPEWHSCDDLPYDKMWDDDIYWLPHILAGDKVRGYFTVDQQDRISEHKVEIVEDI